MTTDNLVSFDTIIGIAGKMGSGKSFVAKQISEILNFPKYSFGSYIVEEARHRHLETDRETLQNLGEGLVKELGPEQFLKNFWLSTNNSKSQILDGIRHVEIWKYIQTVSKKAILIYLDIDQATQLERLCARDKIEKEVALYYLQHPVEKNVDLLIPEADITISGSLPKEQLLELVDKLIET